MNVVTRDRKARLQPAHLEWEDATVHMRIPYARITAVVHRPEATTVELAFADRPALVMAFPSEQSWAVERFAERLSELAGSGEPGDYYERSTVPPRYFGLTFKGWFGLALSAALVVHVVVSLVRGMPEMIGFAFGGLVAWLVFRAIAGGMLEDVAVARHDRALTGEPRKPFFSEGWWAPLVLYGFLVLLGAVSLLLLPVAAFVWSR